MQAEGWSKNKQADRRTVMKKTKGGVFRDYAKVPKITAVENEFLFSTCLTFGFIIHSQNNIKQNVRDECSRTKFPTTNHYPFTKRAINEGRFVLKMILHDRLRRKQEKKTCYISEVQIRTQIINDQPQQGWILKFMTSYLRHRFGMSRIETTRKQ